MARSSRAASLSSSRVSGFDRLGMARVRQNLHSDGSGRLIQATLINADLGAALAARRRAAPVFPAYRTVLVPLQSVYWVTCERFATVRTAAEGYPRAQVDLRGRLAAPARGVYRAYPVEVVFGNDRLPRQMPGNGLNVCFRVGVEDSPAVALSEQKKLQGSDSPRVALAAEDAACVKVTYQRVLRFSRQEPPRQFPDDLGSASASRTVTKSSSKPNGRVVVFGSPDIALSRLPRRALVDRRSE